MSQPDTLPTVSALLDQLITECEAMDAKWAALQARLRAIDARLSETRYTTQSTGVHTDERTYIQGNGNRI